MKYIKNGRIVMPDRIIDGKVLAYDGQTSGYINAGDIPEGAEVIDAQGNYVCPGDSFFRLRTALRAATISSSDTVIVVGRNDVTPFSAMPYAILRIPSGFPSDVSSLRYP